MKKTRKISIAWPMVFAVMSWLLVNQWGRIAAVLAGLVLALWLTSRIKAKLFYATWLILPFLCFFCLNSVGNRVMSWTDKNSPKFVATRAVEYFEKISDGKLSEMTHNLADRAPKAKQRLTGKAKDVFQKTVSETKKITNHQTTNRPLFKT